MLDGSYNVVWDSTHQAWLSGRDTIALAAFLLFGAFLLWLNSFEEHRSPDGRRKRALLRFAVAVAIAIVMVIIVMGRSECDRLRAALRGGRARIVAGTVTDFHPAPPGGNVAERFTVAGRTFEYRSSDGGCAFHRPASEGGPIRAGMQVRILEVEGRIVRLEVRRGEQGANVAAR